MVLHGQRSAQFRKAGGNAFMLNHIALAFEHRNAVLYRHGEMFRGGHFRFCEARSDISFDLGVREHALRRWSLDGRFGHNGPGRGDRCCLAKPREGDGKNQSGDIFPHADPSLHQTADRVCTPIWNVG